MAAIESSAPRKAQRRRWLRRPSSPVTIGVFIVCLLNPVLPEVIYRVDPLALLAATLRTYQRAGCDSEQLSLNCTRGTSISIELAQYGRAGDLSDHSLCPPVSHELLDKQPTGVEGGTTGDGVIRSGTEIEVKPPETCTVSGLQYALLQTVVDACQKKRHCKFAAIPQTHAAAEADPCSGIRKFVEIAYKCRPYEFRSKVACENDNMPLVCNPYSRIAIYTAAFGHTQHESVQCGSGNAPDAPEDSSHQTCQVSYATETVMQLCHGRRRCSITADAGTFGRPCKSDVRMYLKVVYTCIPRKVLKDRYETAAEADEPQQTELDMDQDELYDEDQFYKESEAIPPAPKLQGAIPNPGFPYDFGRAAGASASTLTPPLLSRNDNSLEDGVEDDWFSNSDELLIDSTSSSIEEGVSSTVDMMSVEEDADEGSDEEDNEGEKQDNNVDEEDYEEEEDIDKYDNDDDSTAKNFFYRRKCHMQDDWGPIGLNCTDADMALERVEVVGFLLNWIEAYVHIRKNQEQFYLYLIISVAAGVVLCLVLVIGRLALQRRRTHRKNSGSNGSHSGKHCDVSGAEDDGKYQAPMETHLPNSYGDDISDIDADIDLTSPMPVPSLSRNETYMAYAPTPSCTYGHLPPPHSAASISSASTLLMPPARHGAMLVSGHSNPMGGSGVSGSRQATPPPGTLYASLGVCPPSVNSAMTMGPHMLTAAALGSLAHQGSGTPSYLTGSIMVPGHHHPHPGTLRRSMIPTSMGLIGAPSPPPTTGNIGPHSISGIPSATSIYYESTIPRSVNRGLPTEHAQYFYG